MLISNVVQPLLLLVVVVVLTPLLGAYIASAMTGRRTFLSPVLGPVERLTYRALRVNPDREQGWKAYALAVLWFSIISIAGLYLLQRIQGLPFMPFNPGHRTGVAPFLALNTAVSFVTNTNWQNYVGEQTMSHFTQMAGLAVQNFVSAAVGIAVAVALIRGVSRSRSRQIGNFWA